MGSQMLAQEVLRQDSFTNHPFVLRGRKANLLKIIFWDGTGLSLFTNVLSKARSFGLPMLSRVNHCQ
jgi:transposase